jgi:hypothetical protein
MVAAGLSGEARLHREELGAGLPGTALRGRALLLL